MKVTSAIQMYLPQNFKYEFKALTDGIHSEFTNN